MTSVWQWECIDGSCQKIEIDPNNKSVALSLSVCRLFCSKAAALWPKPTGEVTIGNISVKINANAIDVIGSKSLTRVINLVESAAQIFKEEIQVRNDLIYHIFHINKAMFSHLFLITF